MDHLYKNFVVALLAKSENKEFSKAIKEWIQVGTEKYIDKESKEEAQYCICGRSQPLECVWTFRHVKTNKTITVGRVCMNHFKIWHVDGIEGIVDNPINKGQQAGSVLVEMSSDQQTSNSPTSSVVEGCVQQSDKQRDAATNTLQIVVTESDPGYYIAIKGFLDTNRIGLILWHDLYHKPHLKRYHKFDKAKYRPKDSVIYTLYQEDIEVLRKLSQDSTNIDLKEMLKDKVALQYGTMPVESFQSMTSIRVYHHSMKKLIRKSYYKPISTLPVVTVVPTDQGALEMDSDVDMTSLNHKTIRPQDTCKRQNCHKYYTNDNLPYFIYHADNKQRKLVRFNYQSLKDAPTVCKKWFQDFVYCPKCGDEIILSNIVDKYSYLIDNKLLCHKCIKHDLSTYNQKIKALKFYLTNELYSRKITKKRKGIELIKKRLLTINNITSQYGTVVDSTCDEDSESSEHREHNKHNNNNKKRKLDYDIEYKLERKIEQGDTIPKDIVRTAASVLIINNDKCLVEWKDSIVSCEMYRKLLLTCLSTSIHKSTTQTVDTAVIQWDYTWQPLSVEYVDMFAKQYKEKAQKLQPL
jgi:hypothetical protein